MWKLLVSQWKMIHPCVVVGGSRGLQDERDAERFKELGDVDCTASGCWGLFVKKWIKV